MSMSNSKKKKRSIETNTTPLLRRSFKTLKTFDAQTKSVTTNMIPPQIHEYV